MTRSALTYITPQAGDPRQQLVRGAAEANMASARQWRLDNPEFFASDPATLPDRAAHNRGQSRGTHP